MQCKNVDANTTIDTLCFWGLIFFVSWRIVLFIDVMYWFQIECVIFGLGNWNFHKSLFQAK